MTRTRPRPPSLGLPRCCSRGALGESPSKRPLPVPGWRSATPTLKKMKPVAQNLNEDLRSVSQAPTSSEAATRLSADKDDEDEEEDESNISRLEGPNIMERSPTMSGAPTAWEPLPGSRSRSLSMGRPRLSCLKHIGSASVTGSAECLPALQKMVGDVSRAKQALPSEFTSSAAQALRGHLVDFGRKCRRTASAGQT